MEILGDIADYRMRFLPKMQNCFSTIRTREYYKAYLLGIRRPWLDLQLSRHMVCTMTFNLSNPPLLPLTSGAGSEHQMGQ